MNTDEGAPAAVNAVAGYVIQEAAREACEVLGCVPTEGEDPLEALGWAMGETHSYAAVMTEFANQVVRRAQAVSAACA